MVKGRKEASGGTGYGKLNAQRGLMSCLHINGIPSVCVAIPLSDSALLI